eukprot:11277873-Alexandrium_andersonii.AAC.1
MQRAITPRSPRVTSPIATRHTASCPQRGADKARGCSSTRREPLLPGPWCQSNPPLQAAMRDPFGGHKLSLIHISEPTRLALI